MLDLIRAQMRRLAYLCGYRNRFNLFEKTYLKSLGFRANTIIDVGVDYGTPELYKAFPNSLFILVDPQRDAESRLEHRPDNYIFINKALGGSKGQLTLRQQDEGKTTLLQRTQLTASAIQAEYLVELTTLDAVLDETDFKGPLGIKVDTEGYEIEVIKGLEKYREQAEFVICETSVRKRFVESYQFSELVSFMLEHGFAFFNFLNPTKPRPLFYDLLFVARGSDLLD